MRLINADDLIADLQERLKECDKWVEVCKPDVLPRAEGTRMAFMECIMTINNMPTVKPAVGHWVILPPCFEDICYCSNCETRFKEALQHTDTCPNCNAIMTGCE